MVPHFSTAYDTIGRGYSGARRPDPRVGAIIERALGGCERIVNVGAGTGNYEPLGRTAVAVDPSVEMISQRPVGSAPAVRADAVALPLPDMSFDAAMAIFTVHHWMDLERGLAEMARVSRRQVLLICEPIRTLDFWLLDYFPGARSVPSELRAPSVETIRRHLDVRTVEPVPVPRDCTDGFGAAYWSRPGAYLDPKVRGGISMLAQLSDVETAEGAGRLRTDLESGEWDNRYGWLHDLETFDCGYRLVVAQGRRAR